MELFMDYIKGICTSKRAYFKVLENNFPTWLNEYINTKEMLRLQYVSASCGKIHSKMFNMKIDYNTLDHSIAVALIVWHFTKNKKQTLAGLFHDISTPVFKHCVDFMNGDYLKQESTESLTKTFILNSKEIMTLLKRDNIKIDEVADYHIYPIADNETPKLSADRLEYSLSNSLFLCNIATLDDVNQIYDDIEIQIDENGVEELGFKTKNIARKFVGITSKLSIIYRDDNTRFSMQFLADIMKKLNNENLVTIDDLYQMKESEIIDLIKNSKYKEVFSIWQNAKRVNISKEKPKDVYSVNIKAKVRYIDPLFRGKRMSNQCKIAKKMIDKNFDFDMSNYLYLNFNF